MHNIQSQNPSGLSNVQSPHTNGSLGELNARNVENLDVSEKNPLSLDLVSNARITAEIARDWFRQPDPIVSDVMNHRSPLTRLQLSMLRSKD